MSDATAPGGAPNGAAGGAPGTPWAIAPPPPAQPDLTPSRPVYDGRLSELYAIFLRHLMFMVLTLGWSRFWGRTRVRRYLWSHMSVLGDRFEYRGRGLELFLGFVVVLLLLVAWGGAIWAAWYFLFDQSFPGEMGVIDVFSISLILIGAPLAFTGQYTGLRYRLSRTRWRGIRLGLGGSAWRYGFLATFLNFANAVTGNLLQPVVSVQLARPRISNASVGTQGFEFAGRAGDIYGRYVGYYFLNILAWVVAIGIGVAVFLQVFKDSVQDPQDLLLIFSQPSLRTIIIALVAAIGLYLLFGLLVLPLRCWWQAYLLRYLASHTRSGPILFASSLTTGHMWGFLVLNYLIVIVTLGIGWPWVLHRTMRLIANELWIYGVPDGASIGQLERIGPRLGEGLLDMFDISGI
jgi:uncharacterized membrane protein YjgN (DUF898 family)